MTRESDMVAKFQAIVAELQSPDSPFVVALAQGQTISEILNPALTEFAEAYIDCALWSSTAEDGESFEYHNYGPDDLAPATLEAMRADCADFVESQSEILAQARSIRGEAYGMVQAGHDFWLTRNGHGAGFWDRGLGEVGDRLSDAAKAFGSSDLYVGDDGRIYAS